MIVVGKGVKGVEMIFLNLHGIGNLLNIEYKP